MNTECIATQPQPATSFSMTNLTYVALPIGSIRIGHTVASAGGEVLPVGSDEFRVTKPLREADGNWIADDIDASLRKQLIGGEGKRKQKLTEIPIKFLSNRPELAVRSRYEAFDASGRSVCASNGNGKAIRESGNGSKVEVDCAGCDRCAFAQSVGECKLFGRISVQIEGQQDGLGTYVLRTASINTLRSFETNLRAYHALFGGRLRGGKFSLKLREVQSQQSDWASFFVVDLAIRDADLSGQMGLIKAQCESDASSGLNFEALESLLLAGLDNGGLLDDTARADGVDSCEFFNAGRYLKTYQAMGSGATSSPLATVQVGQPAAKTSIDLQNVVTQVRGVDSAGEHCVPGGGAFLGDFDLSPTMQDRPAAVSVPLMQGASDVLHRFSF